MPATSPSPERDDKPHILVIGDVMLDVIAWPERPIEAATDTPAIVRPMPGGSGANVATWLGYFGNRVTFAGRVGRAGHDFHTAALRAHGVEPFLARDETTQSGTLVTLIGAGGERTFLTDRGANANLARADLPDTLLERIAFIHVSGYAFMGPGPRAAVRDFLAVAAARAIPNSVDCGSAGFLRDAGGTAFFDWTRGADVCFSNAGEAALLTQTNDRGEQLRGLAAHYECAIVTDGADGARAVTSWGAHRHAVTAPTVAAHDTTGAGDAFVAGFLTAHLRGAPISTCLERGAAAGSAAVLHSGGRPPYAPATSDDSFPWGS